MKWGDADLDIAYDDPININMRCIEMVTVRACRRCKVRININMRCIEIPIKAKQGKTFGKININMRCIEIRMRTAEKNGRP